MEKIKAVNVIRHLAFEDLGSFAPLLLANGYQINYFDAACDDLSQLDALSDDLLIVLGGPISVNDVDQFAFIEAEISLLKQRIAADKPTLGICLGAQLIAAALGAKVYPGAEKEIGWCDLLLTPQGEQSVLRYLAPAHCRMLHWHGETFDLPVGAVLLAATEKFQHQAFSYANSILALQFHPEITLSGMEQWFVGHFGEIMQTPEISVAQLRDETRQFASRLEQQSELFFNDWLNQVAV